MGGGLGHFVRPHLGGLGLVGGWGFRGGLQEVGEGGLRLETFGEVRGRCASDVHVWNEEDNIVH